MWKLILLSTYYSVADPSSTFLNQEDCVAAGKEALSQPGTYDIKASVGLGFTCIPAPAPYVCTGSGAGKEPTCYQLDPPK